MRVEELSSVKNQDDEKLHGSLKETLVLVQELKVCKVDTEAKLKELTSWMYPKFISAVQQAKALNAAFIDENQTLIKRFQLEVALRKK